MVAAGEAQIESTVAGNDSLFSTTEESKALRDQSQVYLPINNALSEVGYVMISASIFLSTIVVTAGLSFDSSYFRHVHGFLEEIGQGVQHIASRVDNLPAFVQRGNDYREITGEVRMIV